MAIRWGVDLVTINVPPPELVIIYGYKVLRVCGEETDMLHRSLLPYDTLAFLCLDIP